eukprot:scaffold21781_cov83-Isochrysis_galbana.AAC.2
MSGAPFLSTRRARSGVAVVPTADCSPWWLWKFKCHADTSSGEEPRTRRAGKLSDAGQGATGPDVPRGCPTGVSAP